MSVAVVDASIDGAQAVVVKFTGIELTANGGNPVDITFSQPQSINLLNQSGTITAPEDVNSMASATDTNQPLASKVPVANSQPPYHYQFTFLPPGDYTVAFTCQAALDNPDQADNAVHFKPILTGITVTANQTTTVDIL